MSEVNGEDIEYFGLSVVNPKEEDLAAVPELEEVEFSLGLETTQPDYKYQDRGKIYFLDGVYTGERCETPVKTYKE